MDEKIVTKNSHVIRSSPTHYHKTISSIASHLWATLFQSLQHHPSKCVGYLKGTYLCIHEYPSSKCGFMDNRGCCSHICKVIEKNLRVSTLSICVTSSFLICIHLSHLKIYLYIYLHQILCFKMTSLKSHVSYVFFGCFNCTNKPTRWLV
jgi:hypothetical protein